MAKWDGEWSGRGEAHAYEAGYNEARQRAERAEKALRAYRDEGYVLTREVFRLIDAALAADPQPTEVVGEEG